MYANNSQVSGKKHKKKGNVACPYKSVNADEGNVQVCTSLAIYL